MATVELETLLALLVQVKGSDLHLCADEPPTMRVRRIIRRTKFPELSSDEVEGLLRPVVGEERWERLEQERPEWRERLEAYRSDFGVPIWPES